MAIGSSEYRPTRRERDAIETAFAALLRHARSDYEASQWAKQEARGYGNAGDRCPLIMAKALLCKWFLHGANNPDALLRDNYALRPAAIWATGHGAAKARIGALTSDDLEKLEAGVAAHEAAFERFLTASASQ